MSSQKQVAVVLLLTFAGSACAQFILTGVNPGYEPEQPTFMYTNFGIVFGPRELQKQFQYNSATDDINHRLTAIIGTSGRIPENVTPYQGDPPSQDEAHKKRK